MFGQTSFAMDSMVQLPLSNITLGYLSKITHLHAIELITFAFSYKLVLQLNCYMNLAQCTLFCIYQYIQGKCCNLINILYVKQYRFSKIIQKITGYIEKYEIMYIGPTHVAIQSQYEFGPMYIISYFSVYPVIFWIILLNLY